VVEARRRQAAQEVAQVQAAATKRKRAKATARRNTRFVP
jgi:hypothetical protein